MTKKVLIIAEVGVNHNGSLSTAKKLIEISKAVGADIVKFQTYKTENIVTNHVKTLRYQRNNKKKNISSQFELLKSLELTERDFLELKDYSEKVGIEFLTTVFGLDSIDFLRKLNLNYTKVPSGEILNVPYLRRISKLQKPIILSTGMANYEEIAFSIGTLTDDSFPREKITLLHCITMYPTPINFLNLNVIYSLKNRFNLAVGLSDHSESTEVPLLAMGMGCRIIEKHLTLDNNQNGPDHHASLNPINMEKMIQSIRSMETALGDGIKKPTNEETETLEFIRPKIICKDFVREGERINESSLMTLRSNKGLDARYWDSIVGTLAKQTFLPGDPIE